jgi:hypothetical protein
LSKIHPISTKPTTTTHLKSLNKKKNYYGNLGMQNCSWVSGIPIVSLGSAIAKQIVKPVYKGHSREPENVPFMRSCP